MATEEFMYPKGLRVLVVDDDIPCLKILVRVLKKCTYTVTFTTEAKIGLKMLRENNDQYDIVLTDVHMPSMNGFTLLKHIRREFDIPVIMVSGDGNPKQLLRGVEQGAVDYLLKPVRYEELKNIWQHVVRRNQLKKLKGKAVYESESENDCTVPADTILDETLTKKRKDGINKDDEEAKVVEEVEPKKEAINEVSQKRPRIVWSPELHKKFVVVVNQLGVEKAFPKRILKHMGVEGLTRENIASHLQKYRIYLRKQSKENDQPKGATSVGPWEIRNSSLLNAYGRLSSFGMSPTGMTSTTYPGIGLIGQLNTTTAYRAPVPQVASKFATPLSQIRPIGNFQLQNNNVTVTGMRPAPVMVLPTHVRPQMAAPRLGVAAAPPHQQAVFNQNQVPSSSFSPPGIAQTQHALQRNYAADANAILNGQNETMRGSQDPFTAQNVTCNIAQPQTWQQNMIGSTSISTVNNNNNYYYNNNYNYNNNNYNYNNNDDNNENNNDNYKIPVQVIGSSNQSFGQVSSVQFKNNVDQSFGMASSSVGGTSNAAEVQPNDFDALIDMDYNYFLEESEIIAALIDERDDTSKEIVGKLPN